MAKFCLRISGDHDATLEIDAANGHEAINVALNALSKFAGRQFPPPENVSITVLDETKKRLATLRFSFAIDYADQFTI